MTDDPKTLRKIVKMQKENKKLQELLECAENEMKNIVIQSQEESKQLQKMLQAVWPKLQNRVSKSEKQKLSKGVQTEVGEEWGKHLNELGNCLRELESQALELMRTQEKLRVDLEEEKEKERMIVGEMEKSQSAIIGLESDIAEAKKKISAVQEENHLISGCLQYEALAGCPPSSILSLLEN